MAEVEITFEEFKPDSAGISELFRSAGMVAVCDEAASKVLSAANGAAVAARSTTPSNVKTLLKKRDKSAYADLPYSKKTKVLSHTAIGAVQSNTIEGAYDNNQHHTLARLA